MYSVVGAERNIYVGFPEYDCDEGGLFDDVVKVAHLCRDVSVRGCRLFSGCVGGWAWSGCFYVVLVFYYFCMKYESLEDVSCRQWPFRTVNFMYGDWDYLTLIFHSFSHFSMMCKCSEDYVRLS